MSEDIRNNIIINSQILDKNKVIFLDRDGVINSNLKHYYITSIAQIELLPFVSNAFDKLSEMGYSVIIISNQSCIGKELVSSEIVREINMRLISELDPQKSIIKAIFWCPHKSEEGCSCKKPEVGLLEKAFKYFNLEEIEKKTFWFIGDSLSDVLCAKNFGINSILIESNTDGLYQSILEIQEYLL